MLGWAGGFVSMFVAELVLLIALNKAGAGLFELCMYTPFLLAAIYFPFRFVISKWAHRNDGAIDSLMDRFKKLTAQSNRVALHSASTETPTLVERLSENA